MDHSQRISIADAASARLKGVLLCLAIACGAFAIGRWVDAVVAAIAIGAVLRAFWTPAATWQRGIEFSARRLLEVAVALLGALVGSQALAFLGPLTLLTVASIVVMSIGLSYLLSRALGLNSRMALLVAAGNAICGNSAIAAVAPVIGARPHEVARAITFTAAFSLLVLLMLPLAGRMLALTDAHYGIVAGLTVYAVPHVLAVTLPVSALSADLGTVVKLARIMMLGPVLIALTLFRLSRHNAGAAPIPARHTPLVPWFVVGFAAMAAARWLGLLPTEAVEIIGMAAGFLTLVAMAGLGLGVDLRDLREGSGSLLLAAAGAFLIILLLALGYVSFIAAPLWAR